MQPAVDLTINQFLGIENSAEKCLLEMGFLDDFFLVNR